MNGRDLTCLETLCIRDEPQNDPDIRDNWISPIPPVFLGYSGIRVYTDDQRVKFPVIRGERGNEFFGS